MPEQSTRQLILQAASKLFADRGFHATTTRAIADAVGIQQPGLFHHFTSKAEIMIHLQRMDFSASQRAGELARSLDVSPPVALGVLLTLDLHRLLGGPYVGAGTTQPSVMNDPAFAEGRALYELAVAVEAAIIGDGVRTRDFVKVDPAIAATALEWMVDGVILDAQRDRSLQDDAAVVDLVLRFGLRAILANPGSLDQILVEIRRHVASLGSIDWELPNEN